MSGTIGASRHSDYGMLNNLIADSSTVRQKFDRLTNQASTGLIGDTYAGLGAGASVSLNLRPQVANLQTWQNNIDAATGRMTVTQTAMTAIQSIASNLFARLNDVDGINASAVDSVAATARDALSEVADLLNTRDGNVYVFAAQDSANAPVPNPDNILTSGFYMDIANEVGQLGVQSAATTAANTLAIAGPGGTSPFSAVMSQAYAALQTQVPIAQVDQDHFAPIALLASANSSVVSSGTATTGSYMRDVLRALATIGSLNSGQVTVTDFHALVQDTRVSLTGAISAMAVDAGVLGDRQAALVATQAQHADTQTALRGQISSAEDVDMASTLSQLALVQIQMQASYRLITTLSGLSLVNYLSAG